jgi:hypothetical protein
VRSFRDALYRLFVKFWEWCHCGGDGRSNMAM